MYSKTNQKFGFINILHILDVHMFDDICDRF